LYQDNRENSVNKGNWYARAVHPVGIDTTELANIMQENCTVKESDILAVLQELGATMRRQLIDSKSVKIQNLGTFKIGLSSTGSPTVKDFNAKNNIKGMHIIFLPETKVDASCTKRVKKLMEGATIQELPKNTVLAEDENGGNGGNGENGENQNVEP
jgi:predicted histone-like DNA-binding protein